MRTSFNLKNYLNAKLYLFRRLIRKKGNIITDSKIPEFVQIKKIAKKHNLIIIEDAAQAMGAYFKNKH